MKKYILSLLAMSLMHSVDARTWTSANGKDFFSAIYLRSDDTSITVSMEGKEATFKLSLVSDEDKAWVKAEEKRLADAEKKTADPEKKLSDQFIGANLTGKTSAIIDQKFQLQDISKVPDFYFIYYSASW